MMITFMYSICKINGIKIRIILFKTYPMPLIKRNNLFWIKCIQSLNSLRILLSTNLLGKLIKPKQIMFKLKLTIYC